MKVGWEKKPLGDICKFVRGPFGGSLKKDIFVQDGYAVYEQQHAIYDQFSQIRYFIDQKKFDEMSRFELKSGDLIMSCSGTMGKVAIVPQGIKQGIINQALLKLSPSKSILPTFLKLWMESKSFQESLKEQSGGAAIQNVASVAILKDIKIEYPAVQEQQRIVAILDKAFEQIAIAHANTEKNLQNARALFESHLQSVFTQRGEDWERVDLFTLLERGWIEGHLDGNHGGDYPRKEEFISKGIPYISANCLDGEQIDMSRAKYLSESRAAKLRKGIAKDKDVLFAHNATVGPVATLRTKEDKVILGTSLTYYRCNQKYILPEYLAHYMRSFEFKQQYLQIMQQSTRNQIPITKQREFFHIIPPLDEQKRIISVLDVLWETGKRLEALYQRKIACLDELKKSLLQQAFAGEL